MIKMTRSRRLAAALGLFAFAAVTAVPAQSPAEPTRAVVELFTSQGCSSCPPADALLTDLAHRGDVVALAYHVDYWDYIGWPDTFGNEDNSNRQRAYAASWGSSRIYTPQVVVNGVTDVVGSKAHEVHKALGQATLSLPIRLARHDDMLSVEIDGQAGLEPAVVWLVTFLDSAEVDIERGENEGKSIIYSHVVTGRQAIGMWEPGAGAQLKLPMAEMIGEAADGVAIIVQHDDNGLPGPILGAAVYEATE